MRIITLLIAIVMAAGCSAYRYERINPTTGDTTTFRASSLAYSRTLKSATYGDGKLSIKGAGGGGQIEQITDLLSEINALKAP